MIKKVGKIVIGALIAIIAIGISWYLIDAFTQKTTEVDQVAKIKDDLLTNSVVDEVRDRTSVVDYPITVEDDELGNKNPFK